jgi:uncharacterized protein (TIGR02271 family)
MDVVGSDGDKVGDAAGLEGDYLIVRKGFFFPSDYYIPTSAINSVDDRVTLSVTKDEALHQGWDMVPAADGTDQVSVVQDDLDRPIVDPGLNIENPVPGATVAAGIEETAGEPFEHQATANATQVDDAVRVELAEEELTAQTRPVERGAVQVDKVVTEEQQTLDVPVTDERVTVNRRVVDRDVAPGETTFEEGTIEVPVYGEEVEVEKRARVREEIEVDKEQVTDTERVTDTVRREEARITDHTGSVVEDQDRPTR